MTKDIWQKKSDEELITASEHFSEYTNEAEEMIRAELQRRRMPEPEPTIRTVGDSQPYQCDACGADVLFEDTVCPNCGADISEFDDSAADDNTGSGNPVVQTKYPALRVISVVFKILAVLAAIAGLIGALVGLLQMSGNTYGATATGGVVVLVSLLYGGLGCIYLLAISEGIRVFIDLEENTRLTNELLRKLLGRQV